MAKWVFEYRTRYKLDTIIHYLDREIMLNIDTIKYLWEDLGYNDDKQIFWNYSVPIECEKRQMEL